jgi:RNA-directed DNA polymerase
MAPRPARLLSKVKLREAWRDSRDSTTRAARPGIDGVTAERFAANLDENLTTLARRLRDGSYGPSSLLAVFIPKPNSNKERVICIPILIDRIVQRTIVRYLADNKKLPIYNSSSFGFIRHLGTREAVNAAVHLRRSYDWCVKTDVESFFDRIPRQYLKQRVATALGKHSLTPIICRVIDCEIKQFPWQRVRIEKQGIKLGVGLRQGMPLSPMLANLVLSKFDNAVENSGIKMVRYVDDIVLFFGSKKEAVAGLKFVTSLLKKIDLSVPILADESKTQIKSPSDPIDFLGREILLVGSKQDAVARIPQMQISKIGWQLESDYNFQTRLKENSNFQDTVVDLWQSIAAYLGTYRDAFNYDSLEAHLRATARKIIGDIFLELFGENALSRITSEGKEFLGMGKVDFDEIGGEGY